MTRCRALLLAGATLGLVVFAISRLSFNVEPLDLLPDDLQEVRGLRVLMEHFVGDGEMLITLESESADAELLEVTAASLAEWLESRGGLVEGVEWRPFWQEDAGAAVEIPAYLWFNGEAGALRDLATRLAEGESEAAIGAAMEELAFGIDGLELAQAAYDPFGLLRPPAVGADGFGEGDRFVSEDGLFRVLYVAPVAAGMGYNEAAAWIGRLRSAVGEWRQQETAVVDLVVGYTGEPVFAAEIGGGIQRDMTASLIAAAVLIHLLFWLLHRRVVPLVAILLCLVICLCATVVLGSFMVGELSVMSVGFAAILVGLVVDYGVILYQEARVGSGSFVALRRAVGPGVLWAAATTVAVFASLGLSSLPGIRELGLLVALGLSIGAVVMLWGFGPLAAKLGRKNPMPTADVGGARGRGRMPIGLSVFLVGSAFGVLAILGVPSLDPGFDVLRPPPGAADATFARMGQRLATGGPEALPLVIVAPDFEVLVERSDEADVIVTDLLESGALSAATFLPQLVPSARRQGANAERVETLLREEARLVRELGESFESEAVDLLQGVFGAWRGMLASERRPVRPLGAAAAEEFARAVSEGGESVAALGLLRIAEGRATQVRAAFAATAGVYLADWGALGSAVEPLVLRDLRVVFLPVLCGLMVMLAIVFRNRRDIVLAYGVFVVAAVSLMAAMRLAGWGWNLLNVCAFPLLLGTGIDYTIHMIAALRRHDGAAAAVWRGTGRALVFCGVSTAIGFGSLAFANNAGLASLGKVCALGIVITMIVAVFLLPAWWRLLARRSRRGV